MPIPFQTIRVPEDSRRTTTTTAQISSMSQPVYRRRNAAGFGFEQAAAATREPKAASKVTIREPPTDVRTREVQQIRQSRCD